MALRAAAGSGRTSAALKTLSGGVALGKVATGGPRPALYVMREPLQWFLPAGRGQSRLPYTGAEAWFSRGFFLASDLQRARRPEVLGPPSSGSPWGPFPLLQTSDDDICGAERLRLVERATLLRPSAVVSADGC